MRKKRRRSKKPLPLEVEAIPCELMARTEWQGILLKRSDDEPTKLGRYHGSFFHQVPEYGSKKWVVSGYIVVNWKSLIDDGLTEDEVAQGCLKYLGAVPPRKKFQRKARKPPYGNIDQIPVKARFREKDGKDCIEILFVVDKRRNKHFWGEGIRL